MIQYNWNEIIKVPELKLENLYFYLITNNRIKAIHDNEYITILEKEKTFFNENNKKYRAIYKEIKDQSHSLDYFLYRNTNVVGLYKSNKYMMLKYHKKEKLLEITSFNVDVKVKEYNFIINYRYFISGNKKIYDKNGIKVNHPRAIHDVCLLLGREYWYGKTITGKKKFYIYSDYNRERTEEEVRSFISNVLKKQYYTNGAGSVHPLNSFMDLLKWIESKEKKITTSAKQMLVNKINEKIKPANVPIKINPYYQGIIENIDEWIVIRYFTDKFGTLKFESSKELTRFYINKNNNMIIKDELIKANEFIVTPLKDVQTKFLDPKLQINLSNELLKTKFFKNFKVEKEDLDKKDAVITLRDFYFLTTYKNIEKICKFNLDIFLFFITNKENRATTYNEYNLGIKTRISNMFKYFTKKDDVKDIMNINSKQFTTILKLTSGVEFTGDVRERYIRTIIKTLNEIYKDNINFINNIDFTNMIQMLIYIMKKGKEAQSYYDYAFFELIRDLQFMNLNMKQKVTFIKRLKKWMDQTPAILATLVDIRRMKNGWRRPYQMRNTMGTPWNKMKTIADINHEHDYQVEIDAIANQQIEEEKRKKEAEFFKRNAELIKQAEEKRKPWQYKNEKYIIRSPKDTELLDEGAKQRICIGGYVQSNALGHTNIMLIRTVEDPDTPFYAIEVNNDNKVVQIHGKNNKWVGNNPEVIPTILDWLSKNNIKCTKNILTCTAQGYAARNEKEYEIPEELLNKYKQCIY